MSYLRKSVSKYFRKPKVHDVSELVAETPDITDEIEKVLLELNGELDLKPEEVKTVFYCLRNRNIRKN